MQANIV